MKSFLLLISLQFFVAYCSGQRIDYLLNNYTERDGMPSNTVYAVSQDKYGYLWLGTDAGVCKFDGINFKTFTVNDGLPSNDVFMIFCDSKGKVWLKTFSKEACYIYHDKVFTKHNDSVLNKVKLKENLGHISERDNGDIFLSFDNIGYYLYSDTQLRHYNLPLQKSKEGAQVPRNFIRVMQHNSHLLALTLNGLMMENKNEFTSISKNEEPIQIQDIIACNNSVLVIAKSDSEIFSDTITSNKVFKNYSKTYMSKILYRNDDTSVWVLQKNGVRLYDVKNRKWGVNVLKSNKISCVYVAKNKSVWITTLDNGFYKLNNNASETLRIDGSNSANNFHTLLDDGHSIYYSNIDGQLWKMPKDNMRQSKLVLTIKPKTSFSNRITKISRLNESELLISSDAGFYRINEFNNKLTVPVIDMGIKNHYKIGDTMLALELSNISFSQNNLKSIQQYTANITRRFYVANMFKKEMLVGAEDGLFKFDFKKIEKYKLNVKFEFRVMDLQTNSNSIFVATAGSGIFIIENNNVVRQFNESNGLSSNDCKKQILRRDTLFVATKKGLNIINLKTKHITCLYEYNGLASNGVNDIILIGDTIVASTENGISFINLKNFKSKNEINYYISPFFVNNDTLFQNSISARSNDIVKLTLNSICFDSKSKLKHYYKLKGRDTSWKMTEDHIISLENLDPGDYILESYAENSYLTKSEIVKIPISIEPYFYQLIISKLIATFVLLSLLYFLYKWRIKKIKANEKRKRDLLNKMTKLELSSWRAKINPHFVFNSLNTMQVLFHEQNFGIANKYLSNFSKILRKTIDQSNNVLITIEEEVDYLKYFLELELIKRDHDFEFEIECPKEIINFYLPSMLLQPIIENCFKHGIQNKLNGKINIVFSNEIEHIRCDIIDNGSGFKNSTSSNSKGIDLVSEKIELIEKLMNQKIGFQYENALDASNQIIGAKTTFIFPLITKNFKIDESYSN